MNRPPSKQEVAAIQERAAIWAEHAGDGDSYSPTVVEMADDRQRLLDYITYQAGVEKGLREDLTEAGQELREMQSEINSLERQGNDWGNGWGT